MPISLEIGRFLPWAKSKEASPPQVDPLPDDIRNARISVVKEERPLFERHADSDHPSSGLHNEAVYLLDHGFTATIRELAEGAGKSERDVLRDVVKMEGVLRITGANGETPSFLQPTLAHQPQQHTRQAATFSPAA